MLNVDHLEHLESYAFAGKQLLIHALEAIEDLNNLEVTIKYDGSPSIVFGYDKKGKFLLATKSIFNKTPKVNYCLEDIDANHGKNIELSKKLKKIFYPLKSACELKLRDGFLLHGDLLFDQDDLSYDGIGYRFKQNILEYCLNGTKTQYYKMGIALHTAYEITDFDDYAVTTLKPGHIKGLNIGNAFNKIFIAHDVVPEKLVSGVSCHERVLEIYNMLEGVNNYAVDYAYCVKGVNSIIRSGERISVNAVKTALPDIDDNLILIHQKLHDIKMWLLRQFNHNVSSECAVFLDGNPTNHEGYVIHTNYRKIKLVDRSVFSYANFKRWS